MTKYIQWFTDITLKDIDSVGGKNASLGELINNMNKLHINVPNGFALNTKAWDYFIESNNLYNKIQTLIDNADILDIDELTKCGESIRSLVFNSQIPNEIIDEIKQSYSQLCSLYNSDCLSVAVRSSSTAEDLPDASFAGQQDTYLNISGIENVILKIKQCYASLFNDRAISYRQSLDYPLDKTKLSVGIQKMVRSDMASSGVAFSLDTETGYDNIVLITGSYGLGELVVGGAVIPDEFIVSKYALNNNKYPILNKKLGNKNKKMVYNSIIGTNEIETTKEEMDKFCLSEEHIIQLAQWITTLEKHYSNQYNKKCPIDVEWALDGLDNMIYIVQVRPETIHSNKINNTILEYKIKNTSNNKLLLTGIAIGQKIACGKVRLLSNPHDKNIFNKGDILVTDLTTPDWEPIMRLASAIITNKGGKTSHAAIVTRELGIVAVVGALNATNILKDNQIISVSCAEGDVGNIYEGIVEYLTVSYNLDTIKKPDVKIMLNVGSPNEVFKYANYPHSGVGLARIEFIFNNFIGVHPMALLKHKELNDIELTQIINNKIKNYKDEKDYFIKKLSYGISLIANVFYPHEVIVRFSDFKTNEYVNLIGGKYFEPKEENPMLGHRGASRYYHPDYVESFKLECEGIRFVRDEMGWTNVIPMIPFCRTVDELIKTEKIMGECGLIRGLNDLQIYMMCEIPSNVIHADGFAPYLDGVSIGGNDLLQLTLGLDRDSGTIAYIGNHTDVAYRRIILDAIKRYHECGVKVGFCGQQPSDSTEFAQFLINNKIDTISVTPDSLFNIIKNIEKYN
ncbi:phosphoenolpyruvate synthase [Fadolivirus algeromassiliense]|jgi:pyruvate,water dikinase|uniref:pyruvate, water dikinase n=1 Tax=Fadolivirus FV1/VV64 TaxID=3070911 RepID=A0A7D3V5B9_9VIRU|nr:phosphoenolpyruvate synthase [Fadolivirus algeromassiliense]QKF93592.1 phosphoenolpyruvate synthase [Fadolivirus FV1/VV64]